MANSARPVTPEKDGAKTMKNILLLLPVLLLTACNGFDYIGIHAPDTTQNDKSPSSHEITVDRITPECQTEQAAAGRCAD